MRMQKISKLFGDRVALKIVAEEYEGLIVPAENEQRMYMLSSVIGVGDKVKHVKTGDVVFWQWNAMVEYHNRYQLNGDIIFIMSELDMIAKVDSQKITLYGFTPLGQWCLVRRSVPDKIGRIYVPGQVMDQSNQDMIRYFMVKLGQEMADTGLAADDELIVDRARANPLKIGGQDFYYIQKPFVIGAIGDSKAALAA